MQEEDKLESKLKVGYRFEAFEKDGVYRVGVGCSEDQYREYETVNYWTDREYAEKAIENIMNFAFMYARRTLSRCELVCTDKDSEETSWLLMFNSWCFRLSSGEKITRASIARMAAVIILQRLYPFTRPEDYHTVGILRDANFHAYQAQASLEKFNSQMEILIMTLLRNGVSRGDFKNQDDVLNYLRNHYPELTKLHRVFNVLNSVNHYLKDIQGYCARIALDPHELTLWAND